MKLSETPSAPSVVDTDQLIALRPGNPQDERNIRLLATAVADYILAKLPTMTQGDAQTGTADTKTAITAAVLKAAILAHAPAAGLDATAVNQLIDAAIQQLDIPAPGSGDPIPTSVTQIEAEAGTEPALRSWSPQRVAQAIAALAPAGGSGDTNPTAVTQLEAEAGTETSLRSWSPQRVAQAIAALASAGGGGTNTLYVERSFGGGASSIAYLSGVVMVPTTNIRIRRIDATVADGGFAGLIQITVAGATVTLSGSYGGTGRYGTVVPSGSGISVSAGIEVSMSVTESGEYMGSGAAEGEVVIGIEFERV